MNISHDPYSLPSVAEEHSPPFFPFFPTFSYPSHFAAKSRLLYNAPMKKPINQLYLDCAGLRGCHGTTKRKGTLRPCAQKAIIWRGGVGFCYYHDPLRPKKFGEGYK